MRNFFIREINDDVDGVLSFYTCEQNKAKLYVLHRKGKPAALFELSQENYNARTEELRLEESYINTPDLDFAYSVG